MANNQFDLDEYERKIAAKLTMSALDGDGSVPAARQVIEILDRLRSRQVAEEHGQRMTELADQPIELARYLGYLGEDPRDMEGYLGHSMTPEERSAYDKGRRQRLLELRAVEFDRAVRGQGKTIAWMRN